MTTARLDRKLTQLTLVLLYLTGVAVLPLVHLIETAGLPAPVAHVEPVDFEACPSGHSNEGCVVCRGLSARDHLPVAIVHAPDAELGWDSSLSAESKPLPSSLRHAFPQPRAPPVSS